MTKKQNCKFSLGDNLTITAAKKLHTRLSKCAEKNIDVTLNAEKISKLDTAALQLLSAFVKQITDDGNSVTWHKPSDSLVRVANLMGLKVQLGLVKIE